MISMPKKPINPKAMKRRIAIDLVNSNQTYFRESRYVKIRKSFLKHQSFGDVIELIDAIKDFKVSVKAKIRQEKTKKKSKVLKGLEKKLELLKIEESALKSKSYEFMGKHLDLFELRKADYKEAAKIFKEKKSKKNAKELVQKIYWFKASIVAKILREVFQGRYSRPIENKNLLQSITIFEDYVTKFIK